MDGPIRSRPPRPRSRGPHLEVLEDRLLLSSTGPSVPGVPLPPEGPPVPALAAAPNDLGAGVPTVLADSPAAPAVTPYGGRSVGGWRGAWEESLAAPPLAWVQGSTEPAAPTVEMDRFLLAGASPFAAAPVISLSMDRPPIGVLTVVLAGGWPAHDWFAPWGDGRPAAAFLLRKDLPGLEEPASGSGPQLGSGNEFVATYVTRNVVTPANELAGPRGPVSRPADVPARPALLAALAETEVALERSSADAHRLGAAAGKDPGRPAVPSLGHILAGPLAALADPVNSALPGAATKDADGGGGAALLPAGSASVEVRGKVALPATGGGAAPTGEDPEAVPPQPAGGLDLLYLPSKAAALLEGGLPFDLPALTQGVDAFFARLAALGERKDGVPAYARFVPWLVALSAAAFEFARHWRRESSGRPAWGDEPPSGPTPFLPEEER
jgi:hypothetical protein